MDDDRLFLTLDQGGSASRALVFDAAGRELAAARIEVGDWRPFPGHVEQDPGAVLCSLHRAAESALSRLTPAERARVALAGLDCQRSSLACWDRRDGAPLSPVLSWQDTRAAEWLAAQALDAEEFRASTGLVPNAHFGLSKMRWCLDHLDSVQHAAAEGHLAIGPLAGFLAYRLLEPRACVVDPANAARTLLFDLASGDWNDASLARFGIAREWLPEIVRSDVQFGALHLSAATVPMRLLSGDQSTAAFAYGEPRADTLYANLGTGAFVYRLATHAPTGSRLLRSVIHWGDAPQFVAEGTVNGAGAALAWFAQGHEIADVSAALEAHWQDEGAGDTVFLNGVGGLGSPDWRPRFSSRFIGNGALPQQLVAVAESIVFLLARNIALLQRIDSPCAHLMVSGGVSRSDRFCQALSDVIGLPVRRPAQCEASARGSAFLLAGRPDDWLAMPEQHFEPRANPALQRRHAHWNEAMAKALASGNGD
jgi:glycerol kinase